MPLGAIEEISSSPCIVTPFTTILSLEIPAMTFEVLFVSPASWRASDHGSRARIEGDALQVLAHTRRGVGYQPTIPRHRQPALIALAAADSGAQVAVGYRTKADAASEIVSHIEARGVEGMAFQVDVADPESVRRLVAPEATFTPRFSWSSISTIRTG